MPYYRDFGFSCDSCSRTKVDFRSREEGAPICECGALMVRDFSVRNKPKHARNAAFHKPIELYSLAPETPEQRRELEAVGATFTPEGVPLARDRAEKKRIMKTAGYVEMS